MLGCAPAVGYSARTTSATPERSTAAAALSVSVPAASRAERIASACVAARSVKVTVRFVGGGRVGAVPVIPAAEVSAQPVVDDRAQPLPGREGPARVRGRGRNSALRARRTAALRAPADTCCDAHASWAPGNSGVSEAATRVSVRVTAAESARPRQPRHSARLLRRPARRGLALARRPATLASPEPLAVSWVAAKVLALLPRNSDRKAIHGYRDPELLLRREGAGGRQARRRGRGPADQAGCRRAGQADQGRGA